MADNEKVIKSDQAWREELTPQQYAVLRQHGTEMRGSSPLNAEKRAGVFSCAGCGEPLFSSGAQGFADSLPVSVRSQRQPLVAHRNDRRDCPDQCLK